MTVADGARLADLDQQEALRRSPRATGSDLAPEVDHAGAFRQITAGLGVGRAGPSGPGGAGGMGGMGGFQRGMSPGSLMAIQHLAGNRATMQALGRVQRAVPVQTKTPTDEEDTLTADAGPAAAPAPSREQDAAAGPPGGGDASGGSGGSGGSGDSGGSGAAGDAAGAAGGVGGAAGGAPEGSGAAGGGGAPGSKPGAKDGIKTAVTAAANVVTGKPASVTLATTGVGARTGGRAGARSGGGAAPAPGRAPRKTPPPPIVPGGDAATNAAAQAAGGLPAPGPTAGIKSGAKPTAGAGAGASAGPATDGQGGPAPTAGPGLAPGAPAPAPGAPAPTGPGGVPAPETAQTGIDWNQMLSDYGPPARTVLEITRMVPGWGLLGGLAADSINFASDIASIPNSENADLATGLIVFRNIVNIGNNGLGHILYVNQLIQDGLAGSVVGAEFTPLTAAANEALSTVKVVLDEVQMGTDILVEVESLYQSNHAPTSAEAEQWRSLADGYAANILGDVVNVVLDVISLSSAGAANTAPVQQARQPLALAGAFMKNATPNIIAAVNGVLGVWLGSLVTGGRHAFVGSPSELRAQALSIDAAALFVDIEGPQARTTYDGINAVIDALSAYAEDQIAQINTVAEALSGGKSAFQLIRDAVRDGLDDMNRKLTMVEQLGSMATSAQANAATISEACASVLSALDGMVLPDVTLPSVDIGDGVIADAAEAIANRATQAANAAIREAMSSVSESIETVKGEIRAPVLAVQQHADALGEWLAILATESTAMVATLSNHIAAFSDGLGHCTTIEQVIDLIIGQVSDLTGMPRVTVAEIRAAWNSVGPYIDQFVALGPQMHQRATDLRAHADELESGTAVDSSLAPPPGPPGGPPGTPGVGPGSGVTAAPASAAA